MLIAGLGGGWWVGEQKFGLRETREKIEQTLSGKVTFEVDSNTPGYEIYQKMKQGCPVRDCIPALDDPREESATGASRWLKDEDLVLGVDLGGKQRAYPIKILNWHEIVNDRVKVPDGTNATREKSILVTYAPLTGSAVVYDRMVDGPASAGAAEGKRELTFGASGKVYNSNTVMYDQETESMWQQFTGEAVVGEMTGKKLTVVPVDIVSFKEWKQQHPQTTVLSRETKYKRDYEKHPYGSYESDTALYYPIEGELPEGVAAKTVVYGVVTGEAAKAYTLEAIKREIADDGVLNDKIGNKRIRISYSLGHVFVEDISSRGRLLPMRAFAFAWKAFYPASEIYK